MAKTNKLPALLTNAVRNVATINAKIKALEAEKSQLMETVNVECNRLRGQFTKGKLLIDEHYYVAIAKNPPRMEVEGRELIDTEARSIAAALGKEYTKTTLLVAKVAEDAKKGNHLVNAVLAEYKIEINAETRYDVKRL